MPSVSQHLHIFVNSPLASCLRIRRLYRVTQSTRSKQPTTLVITSVAKHDARGQHIAALIASALEGK